jgi:hypothetical protein
MDPFDLMNPGKLRFDADASRDSTGGDLPSAGWRYESTHRAEADADAV